MGTWKYGNQTKWWHNSFQWLGVSGLELWLLYPLYPYSLLNLEPRSYEWSSPSRRIVYWKIMGKPGGSQRWPWRNYITGPLMWISLRVWYIFNGTILIWTMGSGGALFSDNPNSVYFQHFHSANSSSILGLDHCEPHHANNHHQKWLGPDDLGEVENWGVQQHTCSGFSGFGWGGAVHSWKCSLARYGHGAVEKIKFACDSSFFPTMPLFFPRDFSRVSWSSCLHSQK